MTHVLLATRSHHKVREIGEILHGIRGLRILSLDEAAIGQTPGEDGIEAFHTFLDNSRAKAEYFGRLSGLPTLADDSGLCVDALDGAPGVHSRRFAMVRAGRTDQDAANNALLLHRLQGIPLERRGAAYVCAAALRQPDGHLTEAVASVRGRIGEEAAGTGGFGYDPLFFLPGLDATFAQVPPAEKHSFSHRARAFRALAAALSEAGR